VIPGVSRDFLGNPAQFVKEIPAKIGREEKRIKSWFPHQMVKSKRRSILIPNSFIKSSVHNTPINNYQFLGFSIAFAPAITPPSQWGIQIQNEIMTMANCGPFFYFIF
jgi:hypothetical protein